MSTPLSPQPHSNSPDELSRERKTKELAQRIFPTPKRIGKYKIDGFYAQGGMSMLYIATDPDLQEQVIIKVMQPKLASDRESIDQFLNEAKVISSANHPNIVRFYEYGEWEGGLYIAMEYIKGQSLRKLLQHSPLPLKRALDVLIQTCYAIWQLHSHGIIHGDLKPENILVTDQGQVKVIDFGISRLESKNAQIDEPTIIAPTFKGTPIYMSPEIITNPKAVSFQSDIYALGIIAYELVLGKITHGKVILSLAPRGMQKILNRALKPNPSDRYASILEMIQDLSDYTHSGELAKDRQGADYFFELFETLEEEQKKLMKSLDDSLINDNIGITSSYGIGVNGLYYTSIRSESSLGFFSCSTKTNGVRGVMDIYRIHTLFKQTSSLYSSAQEIISTLLQEMSKQEIFLQEQSILFLDTKDRKYTWQSSRWGKLFISSSSEKNILSPKIISSTQAEAQDAEKKERLLHILQGTYEENSEFFISCCVTPTLLDFPSSPSTPFEMVVSGILKENQNLSPQKKAQHVLQTLRLRGDCMIDDHPALFVSVKRA